MAHYPKKVYCLDTNILIHDPRALCKFKEHDVYIPAQVIVELDRLKKTHQTAREVGRYLRAFIDTKKDLRNGVSFTDIPEAGEATGRLFLSAQKNNTFLKGDGDECIICEIATLKQEDRWNDHKIIFVSEDNFACVMAARYSVYTEGYKTDYVDVESLNNTVICDDNFFVELSASQENSVKWLDKGTCTIRVPQGDELKLNTFCFAESKPYQVIQSKPGEYTLRLLKDKKTPLGICGRNPEQQAALYALMDSYIEIVTLTGRAGTGKTMLALAAGLQQIKYGEYYSAVVSRSLQDLDKDIGSLPGTEEEKVAPWMGAFLDNMEAISRKGEGGYLDMSKDEKLNIVSLNFIRGRSFQNRWIIIDETQNLTPHQVKSITTRVGEGSKIIFLGNNDQIDNPKLKPETNGLTHLIKRLTGEANFTHVHLKEVVRSRAASLADEKL